MRLGNAMKTILRRYFMEYWDNGGSSAALTGYAHGQLDSVGSNLLYVRLEIAPTMQQLFPHLSTCKRCQWPWSVVRGHTTEYENGCGCFPLCEDCWVELRTPENRLPYYMRLVDIWEQQSPTSESKRALIRKAVLSEGA